MKIKEINVDTLIAVRQLEKSYSFFFGNQKQEQEASQRVREAENFLSNKINRKLIKR